MAYTKGRKLDFQALEQIARQYQSRGEFQIKDASAYKTASNKGYLESICKHMKVVSFSIPQLICKDILDTLLNQTCLYNTRKVIPPYEVDLFYKKINLAVEYNGLGWHNSEESIERDAKKIKMLKDKGIFLLTIEETSRDYEKDIKEQMVRNSSFLEFTKLAKQDIEAHKVRWDNIYSKTSIENRISDIKLKIAASSSLKEFRENFSVDYNYLIRNKSKDLLKYLQKNKTYSDHEIISECLKISNYSDFVNSKFYSLSKSRGILDQSSSHMTRNKKSYRDMNDGEILDLIAKTGCVYPSDLREKDSSLYNVAKKRKIKWSNKNRKTKNNPIEIKAQVDMFLSQGFTMNYIKKNHGSVYASYRFYSKKGEYSVKEKKDTVNRNGFGSS